MFGCDFGAIFSVGFLQAQYRVTIPPYDSLSKLFYAKVLKISNLVTHDWLLDRFMSLSCFSLQTLWLSHFQLGKIMYVSTSWWVFGLAFEGSFPHAGAF